MLFRKVFLENIGLYPGKVEFDLTPRTNKPKDKPIILFGGKNGAGKTTFLEALILVLYGKRSFKNRLSKSQYEDYLKSKIHSAGKSEQQSQTAKIALEFDYVSLGDLSTYYVERSWCINPDNGNIDENLDIIVNGVPERDVTEDYWKGFIEGIIPERLAQLFFFDGEKIQDIANDETGTHILAGSIKSLLGLDIVEKLKADLSIYKSRELKGELSPKELKQLNQLNNEIEHINSEIERLKEEELPSIETKSNGKLARIRSIEEQLRSEGNLFFTRQDSLKEKRDGLTLKTGSLENEIREECGKTYPFSLCPTVSNLLIDQLEIEDKLANHSVVKSEIRKYRDEILQEAKTSPLLKPEAIQKLEQLITDLAKSRIELPPELKDAKKILGFSESVSKHIRSTISYAEEKAKRKIRQLSLELKNAEQELRDITIEVEKIPEDEQINPLFEELTILNQEHGGLLEKKETMLREISKFEEKKRVIQKELNKFNDRQASQERLRMVDSTQLVLDEYLQKLTLRKTEQLQKSVAEAFNVLSHKGNLIDRVEVDPTGFTVRLYDKNNSSIPKERLSSGEKQLYAIAMLWGLAKTSGRPLPVIIDTPLGRLDNNHRMNLISNYFPAASHQVILLSTDTEVDKQLFEELKPSISHCFHLEYDPQLKGTRVTEKYFWSENDACLN